MGSYVPYVPYFFLGLSVLSLPLETMAAHRANSLLAILPVALETGYSEVVPELEPLKVRFT